LGLAPAINPTPSAAPIVIGVVVKTYPLFQCDQFWQSADPMFLRSTTRKKDGKVHRYFSIVENRRLTNGQTAQRTVLYLGEINDKQEASWRTSLSVFDQDRQQYASMSLFPEDRVIPSDVGNGIQVRLDELELRDPRACLGTAGWDVSCGENWDWMNSGKNGCRKDARRSAGTRCCSYWSSIG
jgi:hypothetical protein